MRDESVEVVQGDSVTLPSSFFTMSPLSRLNIIWTLAPFSHPDSPSQVRLSQALPLNHNTAHSPFEPFDISELTCFHMMCPSPLLLHLQVIVYDHGQVIEDPSLTGRVGFAGIPWSADIELNDTRVSDAGTYRCVVSNPPETGDPGIGELALSVLGRGWRG